jgi:pyrroline-5-carboxylate reductase
VEKRPELADAALTASLAKTATDGRWTRKKAAQKIHSTHQEVAQWTLGVIVGKRPELADAVLSVTKAAATDSDTFVSEAAQQTLGVIVGRRPEL